jgi:hypothetical protein
MMAPTSLHRGEKMHRLLCFTVAIAVAFLSAVFTIADASEMTFQFINDTDRPLNVKLFSRAESHQQWPSKTKAYSVRPDSAPQQLKISCEEGEQICWGAWMTVQKLSGEVVGQNGQRASEVTTRISAGAGERGLRTCEHCCHVCSDGTLTPVSKFRDVRPEAR